VIEVVQSGLWMRPMEAPRNAESVRAAKPSAEHHTFIFDDATEAKAVRMRALAEDVIARLDPATRERSALVAASMVSTATLAIGAGGQLAIEDQYFAGVEERITAGDWETSQVPQLAPAPTAAGIGFAAESEYVLPTAPYEQVQPVQVPFEPAPSSDDVTAVTTRSAFMAKVEQQAAVPMSGMPPQAEFDAPAPGPVLSLEQPDERPRHAAAEEPAGPRPGLSVLEPVAPFVVEEGPGPERGFPAYDEPVVAGPPSLPLAPSIEVELPPPPVAPTGYGMTGIPSAPVAPPAPVEPPAIVEPAAPVEPPAPVASVGSSASVGTPAPPPPIAPPPVQTPMNTGVGPVDEAEPRDQPIPAEAPISGPPALVHPPAPTPPPPVQPPAAEPDATPEPPVVKEKPRFQPTPEAAASALLSGRGLDEERGWLRRTLSREFDSVASSISRVLSEHPGLQGGDAKTNTEILSDSVAVRLYLSPQGAAIDAGLRTARKGPHVPFARCVVAGLGRLPSHRGATVFSASPSREEWKLLSKRSLLTEWGFLNALTAPSADLTGDVDVLIWAMTARRTKLLEPGGDEHVDNRVLFMPGTSFKVLDIVEPSERGRGQVLIRELSANEIDSEGRVEKDRVSFDELATASLRRCAERWGEEQPTSSVGTAAVARFGALPGLV
jgi:hypothetical protein